MQLSRLSLAVVVSLRAVLVYGEAASATDAALTWRDLVSAWLRLPRHRPPARPARVTAARRYA
jgi:hypothetical protein